MISYLIIICLKYIIFRKCEDHKNRDRYSMHNIRTVTDYIIL